MEKEDPSVENLLLRMKLESMFGGEIFMPKMNDLETENIFLQNIIELEEMEMNATPVSVYEYIDRPEFVPVNNIPSGEMKAVLKDLVDYMNEKGVYLEIGGQYPDETIYRFIVEELFWETLSNLKMPGMESCFVYEDYYPNPKISLELLTTELLNDWSTLDVAYFRFLLSDFCITPEGLCHNKKEVFEKIDAYAAKLEKLEQFAFQIGNLRFQEENAAAMQAIVSGSLSFCSSPKQGAVEQIDGVFEFSFKFDQGFWELYYFKLPGFEW